MLLSMDLPGVHLSQLTGVQSMMHLVMVVDLVRHLALLLLSSLLVERINHNMKLPRCRSCLDYLISMNQLSLVYQLL